MQDAVPLASPLREIGRGRTVNSEFAVYAADFKGTAAIAGYPIQTSTLGFMEVLSEPNVGSEVLKNLAVTFDQRHALARFDLPAGSALRVERPRDGLGLRLGRAGSDYVVAGTDPDTPAAAAGFQEGDRLVAVNGKTIADLPPGDFAAEMRKPVVVLTIDRDGSPREVTLRREG
jgi:membrane-associated protease RseP (regulator of RpoE activity)